MATLHIEEETLPLAWEKSVIECWNKGGRYKTEYDKKEDPESRDCTAFIIVKDPMKEPRIHKAIPAGLEDLEIYNQEVLYGVHDNWINPESGAWQYSYHCRLFDYETDRGQIINQIQFVIKKLSETPYTRRAQAITWQPWKDNDCNEAACLQRMWFRISEDKLLLNVSMRSNDAFKAAYMNMYAFTELQAWVAREISKKINKEIKVGQYTHFADSYHIYGSYFADVEKFINRCNNEDHNNRIISTEDAKYFLDCGKIVLLNNSQQNVPIEDKHWTRLYKEIDQDRRDEVTLSRG